MVNDFDDHADAYQWHVEPAHANEPTARLNKYIKIDADIEFSQLHFDGKSAKTCKWLELWLILRCLQIGWNIYDKGI